GAGEAPERTSSASAAVASTWLRVTSRCTATRSSPLPGTSPWIVATVAVPSVRGSQSIQVGVIVRAASTTTAGTARRTGGRSATNHASVAPERASRKLTPVKPYQGSPAAQAESATPYESLP